MAKEEKKDESIGLKAVKPKPKPEIKYGRFELMQAAPSFGVKPEVVAGALKLAGKDEMTKMQAQAAIKKFLERKV